MQPPSSLICSSPSFIQSTPQGLLAPLLPLISLIHPQPHFRSPQGFPQLPSAVPCSSAPTPCLQCPRTSAPTPQELQLSHVFSTHCCCLLTAEALGHLGWGSLSSPGEEGVQGVSFFPSGLCMLQHGSTTGLVGSP